MKNSTSPLLSSSDKSFWHGYIDFYEKYLPAQIAVTIIEFGVFKGNSIRWLMSIYPDASLIGVDILPQQTKWPKSGQVKYEQVDQGNEEEVASFFKNCPPPALIIEDGSHRPSHQSRCLKHGLNKLSPGGIYILEDIHTSHPDHCTFKRESKNLQGNLVKNIINSMFNRWALARQTSLSILPALEHIKRMGKRNLSEIQLGTLSTGSHFTASEILSLHQQIKSIHVYKRATLPDSCYACGSTEFNYHEYKCACGISQLAPADSMSILITKN